MNGRTKTFSGDKSSMMQYELDGMIDFFQQSGVLSYLEIGARQGDTFVEVMKSLPVGSFGVAVDLPGGLWGKSTTGDKLKKAIAHLNSIGYKCICILGDSTSDEVKEKVYACGKFDAILIDGDHTYKGVRKDFENYAFLAPLVAFHDIVGVGQEEKVYGNPVEVPLFWEDLKHQRIAHGFHSHYAFVGSGSTMGIGVLKK